VSARVTWVGHATVFVEVDGVRLLTDPLLRRRVAHLRRAAKVDVDALLRPDAVLVSHAHHDHLDLPSLDRLDREVPVVVPRGLAPLIRKRGFREIVELAEDEETSFGPVTVRATHADHAGGHVARPTSAPALGFAVLGSKRIYFAGDTDVFDAMDGLVPDLDLALVPIWGWGKELGRGKHMDPVGAAKALALLRPRLAVPIHWGTYHPIYLGLRRPPGFLRLPAAAFRKAAAEHAPGVDVRVLDPGDVLELP
jgi:L-ascorbate metabolism protein UlaG (beta-lactamase superfamily)